MDSAANVTQLLVDWRSGNQEALEQLLPLVYNELHNLANIYAGGERRQVTIQPTVLVNEAYLRLVGNASPQFENRAHFMGIASRLMRQVLVDHARKRRTAKRGSGAEQVSLDDVFNLGTRQSSDVVAIDDALKALEALDPRKVKIIEMRFFGGLSIEETAQALEISVATVGREQRLALAFLQRELTGSR